MCINIGAFASHIMDAHLKTEADSAVDIPSGFSLYVIPLTETVRTTITTWLPFQKVKHAGVKLRIDLGEHTFTSSQGREKIMILESQEEKMIASVKPPVRHVLETAIGATHNHLSDILVKLQQMGSVV